MKSGTENYKECGGKMFDPVEFGKRVREERKRKRWSQEKFAEKICRSPGGYMSDIEHGNGLPALDVAVTIADKLGVSLDYLCGRDQYLKGNITTMGDIARALIALSFLKGASIRIEDQEFTKTVYDPDDRNFERPQVVSEKRQVPVVQIREGDFRRFLPIYRGIFDRPNTEDFCETLERHLKKLDQKSVWSEFDEDKWKKILELCAVQNYPKTEAERIIWNKVPPNRE